MDELRRKVEDAGQDHVFKGWDDLAPAQQASLRTQLESIDFEKLNQNFKASMDAIAQNSGDAAAYEPVHEVTTLADTSEEKRRDWRARGLRMIAKGELGVLLLAGGQGTRLGSADPKGCYNIGLPSNKSLFELQAHRLLRLQRLAAEAYPEITSKDPKPLRWYIMTSQATDEKTRSFFKQHDYFGLQPDSVVFFVQGMLPALTEDGKVIMESPGKLAMAPDGNGGVYTAMLRCGIFSDMASHGIEAVDCYSVDNALVRLGDPVFAGFCKESGIQCGARVVAKAYPEEKVGVFARKCGRLVVVEYSELDVAQATSVDPDTGLLLYNWSNVCLHYFERQWLENVAARLSKPDGVFHVARKQIPSIDGKVPGVKLELFIFDTFAMADHTALLEVERSEEFAPVKNAPGTSTDSPDTARKAILALHKKWIQRNGGIIEGQADLEISPLMSYAGEGLEWIKGKSFCHSGEDTVLTSPQK
jgi:UDP-N-acetylglucosamine/UDP-N-acetylgalactosamine diphosphorylase